MEGVKRADLEFDASQTPVMALERLEVFPGDNIPHHHLAITASADDLVALEPNGIHWTLMPFEGSEEVKSVSIPDADESVFGAADDMLVIDTKIKDTSSMSVEDGRNLCPTPTSEQIPNNNGTVATAGNHETGGEWIVDIPILVKFQAEDTASMTLEGSQSFASHQ